MEISILGPLEVARAGRLIPVEAPRQRVILALLATRAGTLVRTDLLIEALWGNRPPKNPRKALQTHVYRLRRTLRSSSSEEAVVGEPDGYRLQVDPRSVDSHRFEAFIKEGLQALHRGEAARAAEVLRDGLGLWRGAALEEFREVPWAHGEAVRLEELRMGALGARIEAELQIGRHAEAVGELEALVEEHPFREGLHRLLMLALYRSGRQAEALRAYQRASRLLGEELGIEPSAELQALEEAMLLHDPSLDVRKSGSAPPHNLPAYPASFVGRDRELGAVAEALERSRLVTLAGPAGVGKTRLALEAAHGLLGQFPQGVWWVELAGLSDPATISGSPHLSVGNWMVIPPQQR